MLIVRYVHDTEVRLGLLDAGTVRPLGGPATLGELLQLPLADVRALCEQEPAGPAVPSAEVRLLPPVDGRTEVWAAGVTYRRSRAARVAESEASADVYERVYDAARPELFFKSVAWRVTGDGEQVSIRRDSEVNVPEPELALVLNAFAEVVGYTVCNDGSSRSIEGANPLYLPQAKVWLGGCAVGPGIRPAWEVEDPYALGIRMAIERAGAVVWEGEASTDELHRRFPDLVEHLFREDVHPEGVLLSTGTCLVPDLPFTLLSGDRVRISIDQVGTLTSDVVLGKPAMSWLSGGARTPGREPAHT